MFRNRAETQNVIIENKFNDRAKTVFLDEKSMKQAMFHMLSRLLKFTDSNGRISIDVEFHPKNFGSYIITISDSKFQIDLEDLARIQKTIKSNVGIRSSDSYMDFGIVLASNIIRLHNGELSIESQDGKETQIRISLPIHMLQV